MDKVKEIVAEINKGNPKPIYFLMGEEPYYIDRISQYIAENVLTEDEKGFNQMVLYGKETSVDEVVANAKRFPMMAQYQVVIVKEAQHLSRNRPQFWCFAISTKNWISVKSSTKPLQRAESFLRVKSCTKIRWQIGYEEPWPVKSIRFPPSPV